MIGLVGKPSSGKSTTLNSLTDASAKVGAFPFTTIDPNRATGYVQVACACARVGRSAQCKPNYGWCTDGRRSVPIELLDVAGLVPGAHEGRGLGNKFLDDLRHADALIHVVDASGTTDAEGRATRGYDPLADVAWLQDEIFRWVRGNLAERWSSVARRHAATRSTPLDTLANQLSGYGATRELVARALAAAENRAVAMRPDELDMAGETVSGDRVGSHLGTPTVSLLGTPLERWNSAHIDLVVRAFLDEKFPTVLALNKVDHPDADNNISRIVRAHPHSPYVLTSAISEVFLRRLAKQGYVLYEPGTEFVTTSEDEPEGQGLKPLDPKLQDRLETVRDLVLFRLGSTGVADALRAATDTLGLVPVFPVRSIHDFGGKTVFPDCTLVRRGTSVGTVRRKIMGDAPVMYVETVGGLKVAEDQLVDIGKNDILSFKIGRA